MEDAFSVPFILSWLPLYYSHFVIAEFSQYKYFMDQVAIMLKSGNKILYSKQKCRDIGQKRCDSHRGRGTPL